MAGVPNTVRRAGIYHFRRAVPIDLSQALRRIELTVSLRTAVPGEAGIQSNHVCLSTVVVRHVERPLRATSRNPTVKFIDADVTLEAQRLAQYRKAIVDQARCVLEGGEPDTKPSTHCDRPACEFRKHCLGQAGLTIVGRSL